MLCGFCVVVWGVGGGCVKMSKIERVSIIYKDDIQNLKIYITA